MEKKNTWPYYGVYNSTTRLFCISLLSLPLPSLHHYGFTNNDYVSELSRVIGSLFTSSLSMMLAWCSVGGCSSCGYVKDNVE